MNLLGKNEIEGMLNSLGMLQGDANKLAQTKLMDMSKRCTWGGIYPYMCTVVPVKDGGSPYIDTADLGLKYDDAGMLDAERTPTGWTITAEKLSIQGTGFLKSEYVQKMLDPGGMEDRKLELLAFSSGNSKDYPRRPDVVVLAEYHRETMVFSVYYIIG
jgi:hypothetical protein